MANLIRRSSAFPDLWREFYDLGFLGNQETNSFIPAVNISEDEKNYEIEVVAPGFKKEDFKVDMGNDMLTISAETKSESKEGDEKKYSRREYNYSSFTRSFPLPDNAKDDAISAKYIDGVLRIAIPKTKQQQKVSKQINID